MRERTTSKSPPGLPAAGMLKRTKYSRLRNDSLTSLEDNSQRMVPQKSDHQCSESDFALLHPEKSTHLRPSTLKEFIPRVANIRLQSTIAPHALRGPDGGPSDGPLSRSNPGPDERSSADPDLSHPALCCIQRPITLHKMSSICPALTEPRGSHCCLKELSAAHCAVIGMKSRALHHHIKYMGSVEVTQSMRTLDFDTRMLVTREAISRLCERTFSGKSAIKPKKPVCKGASAGLGQINLQFSGSRIILSVSTDSVTLIAASSLQDMAEYIAYVAKDHINLRACHILECPHGRAGEVIDSIGRAFEARFRQLLSQSQCLSASPRSAETHIHKQCPNETCLDQRAQMESEVREQQDYYNVIQGNTPTAAKISLTQPVSMYENCTVTDGPLAPPSDLWQCEVNADLSARLSETQIHEKMKEEGWFHGRLGREQAESLLSCSGDFLVRESSSACGQYVLSGMEGVTVRHLLLVDPHGQVRTRDQVFLSVSHLVRFYMENQTPIVSGSSELCLKRPIPQTH
uniref:SHC adaptor protein 4 n=1 Tax=Gouania willdenowi TaxID=441366 RepID=A0A8C5DRM4_GOUWI